MVSWFTIRVKQSGIRSRTGCGWSYIKRSDVREIGEVHVVAVAMTCGGYVHHPARVPENEHSQSRVSDHRTLLTAELGENESIIQVKGRWRFQGSKKATKLNVSSPFSLCGLNGSDGLGTLTDRAVFTWKSKQYRFVFPKVLVA